MSIKSFSASYDSTDSEMRERIEESDTLNSCEFDFHLDHPFVIII